MTVFSIGKVFDKQAGASWRWPEGLSWLACLFFLLPLLSLGWIATSGGMAAFPRTSILWPALSQTVLLLAGSGAIALLFAVPLAWVMARHDFPLRRLIDILSVLPLALPGYLAAFSYVSLSDHFGPLQTALRALSGAERLPYFPELRSLPGACFVLGVTLYPYIYLPARWSFERQCARQIEAARSLGASRNTLLLRIALPLAWPAMAAGLTLALLEALNDIGATQYLGVQSLGVVTFTTWTVRDNLAGAAQLALVLLAMVGLLIALEGRSRRMVHYADSSRRAAPLARRRMTGSRALAMTMLCLLPFTFGFLAPFSQLFLHAMTDLARNGLRSETLAALGNTLLLAAAASIAILAIGFGLALMRRIRPSAAANAASRLSILGYGVPGLILVIGILPVAGLADQGLHAAGLITTAVISGSAILVVLAYALRFCAIATGQAEAAMQRLSANIDRAAATLGASRQTMAFRILLPQLWPAMAAAGMLIAVDCIKELPATLLLRPFNTETLATLVYEAASRGAFEEGATAALLIVTVGLVPLLFLFRLISRGT
jgi:iron(III) transport system permease protein